MKIIMIGDIVASEGRKAFAATMRRYRDAGEVDFVVVNAENAAGGRGITEGVANELFAAGADVITLGDHAWDQKELAPRMGKLPRLLRPANFAPGCPGTGRVTVSTAWGDITVINLIGRVFMRPYDCPFRKADEILNGPPPVQGVVLVDMHAEATSEKLAMGRYLDGRVSAVVGTHTHVQTSDEAILPNGTGYLTDLGMTGSKDSILGRDVDCITRNFLTGMPTKFLLAKRDVKIEGVRIEVDRTTGKALTIERIRESYGD